MKLFIDYIKTILNIAGWRRTLSALALMLSGGALEGFGLLMLVPMLGLVGITNQGGTSSSINKWLSGLFEYTGLSKNLIVLLLIYVAITSLRAYFTRLTALFQARLQQDFSQAMRDSFFRYVTYANWLFFTKNRASNLLQVLTSDLNRVAQGMNTILNLASQFILLGIYLSSAFALSFEMTAISCVSGVVILAVLRRNTKIVRNIGKDMTHINKDLYSAIKEQLGAMKITKSYCREENNLSRFLKASADSKQTFIRFVKNSAGVNMWFSILSTVILSIIVYIAIEILNVPSHILLVLLFIFSRTIPQLSGIQQGIQQLVHILPAFESYTEMKTSCVNAEERTGTNNQQPVALKEYIKFNNVTFRYNTGENEIVLKNINVTINAYQTTAIMGPSGSGKSTIADLLLGLLLPDEGDILIDGRPMFSLNLIDWRKNIGYVPQDSFFFHDTVRSNLLWANPDATEVEINEVLELCQAIGFVGRLPEGIDTVIGDRGVCLSGGERQRLALARALIIKPKILILDEATNSLDMDNEHKLLQTVERFHGKLTIIIISHKTSTIRNADKILRVRDNRIDAIDSLDNPV